MVAVALAGVVSRQADFHDTVNVAGNTVSIHRPRRCEVDVCANVVESRLKAGAQSVIHQAKLITPLDTRPGREEGKRIPETPEHLAVGSSSPRYGVPHALALTASRQAKKTNRRQTLAFLLE